MPWHNIAVVMAARHNDVSPSHQLGGKAREWLIWSFKETTCHQCWKFSQDRQSEADNFGGGPGTFCRFFFNFIIFMFMIWDSRHEGLQLFRPSFKHCLYRARRFPLPDGLGQVKVLVRRVDLNRFFLFISYKQIEEFQNSWSRASDDFEKREALLSVWHHS